MIEPKTPIEASLRAFDALVREGKVRYLAASNYACVPYFGLAIVSGVDFPARRAMIGATRSRWRTAGGPS